MSYSQRGRLPSRELDLMVRFSMPESFDIQCFDDNTINVYRRVCRGFSRKLRRNEDGEVFIERTPDLELLGVAYSEHEFFEFLEKAA
jgi:hypothetical protein